MIDIESTVFAKVAEAYDAAFPGGARTGEPINTPAKFPCLSVVEDDNFTYEKSLDTSMREHHAQVLYTVDVFSNLTSGAKQQCQNIMNVVDDVFQDLGFVRLFCNQTKNQDNKIYRMTARYRAVVSEDFRIYRR